MRGFGKRALLRYEVRKAYVGELEKIMNGNESTHKKIMRMATLNRSFCLVPYKPEEEKSPRSSDKSLFQILGKGKITVEDIRKRVSNCSLKSEEVEELLKGYMARFSAEGSVEDVEKCLSIAREQLGSLRPVIEARLGSYGYSTPYMIAMEVGEEVVSEHLIIRGANSLATDTDGLIGVNKALLTGRFELLERFLEYGY